MSADAFEAGHVIISGTLNSPLCVLLTHVLICWQEGDDIDSLCYLVFPLQPELSPPLCFFCDLVAISAWSV